MAFIIPRRGRKGVYVYFHERVSGKQKQIPRKLTKHLDKCTPQEVQAWLENWEKKNGKAVDRSERINLKENDRLSILWAQYQASQADLKNRREVATKAENALFENHILPFFVGQHENKRPETWHDLVPEFHAHMFSKKLGAQTMRTVLWTLKRFGEHLVWSRFMSFPYAIKTPKNKMQKVTPLKKRLDPEDVFKAVAGTFGVFKSKITSESGPAFLATDEDIRLSILLGYFASLRPQEQWALKRSDFLTGDEATKHSKTLSGFQKNDLGTKLSIVISKSWQRGSPSKIENLTKSHYSKGVVNVWHPKAAKMIADILKNRKEDNLFSLSYSGWFQLWRKKVEPILGVSAHDLRRASGYYLGRVKRIELTLLQDHMRHSNVTTTMLYTRDPEVPEIRAKDKHQDFDDVI